MPKDRTELDTLKSTVDIKALLMHYGGVIAIESNDNIRSSCVVHGGSNVSSLSYNTRTGWFKCFGTCGFTGDVFKLIQTIERCTFADAVERVREYSSANNGLQTSPRKRIDDRNRALEAAYGGRNSNEVISSPLVERALKYRPNPYVVSEKFKQDTMEYFQVGYCDFNDYFMNRAIITIHDEYGSLIGFSGRDMKNKDATNKYRIKKGFKKGYCLYNLNRAKEFIDRGNPMIICEGFGQVWRLHEAGYPTGVALMGKDATQEQLELILRFTTNAVLALDFDSPGMDATMNLIEQLDDKIDLSVIASKYGENVDLADMSVSTAQEVMETRIPPYYWVNAVYKKG